MSRKLRSVLTILMVMAGSSLLNAVNAFGAALTQLFDNQFSNLVPNIMMVTQLTTIGQPGDRNNMDVHCENKAVGFEGCLNFVVEVVIILKKWIVIRSEHQGVIISCQVTATPRVQTAIQ